MYMGSNRWMTGWNTFASDNAPDGGASFGSEEKVWDAASQWDVRTPIIAILPVTIQNPGHCSQIWLRSMLADEKQLATGCLTRPDVALMSDIIVEYSDPIEPISARNPRKRPILGVT
ncbi:hypothetical protein ACJ72_00687 [Emergomyces africanus]|uniref:Uncharacterized protein n=1 Tax=Emergomyces africanus TaxID=1955775 RepID=A0A1B7P7C5_9EURO|nr:hypothetical protein ACJ72_00687 [Emergomyces africanus]